LQLKDHQPGKFTSAFIFPSWLKTIAMKKSAKLFRLLVTEHISFLVLLISLMVITGFRSEENHIPPSKIEIRGIYGSPVPFWKKNIRLDDLGVNAVFLNHGAINEGLMKQAKAEGLKVFAEFATLNGKSYVNDHPEAWAIDRNGNKVAAATWF